jgi:hypothetical protein
MYMSDEQPRQDTMRLGRYADGDHVKIVYGREAGRSGVIVEVLQERWRVRYGVEVGSGYKTYCEETDLVLEKA